MTTKHNDAAIAGKQKIVSITRTFNLPLDVIWKAWTEPESFKKWWGPNDFTCPSCTIDLRVGGKIISSMKGKDGKEIWSALTFREMTPMKRLVYKDEFSDKKGNPVPASEYGIPGEWPDDVKITVTLEDLQGKTKMTMKQEPMPEEMYNDCVTGWQECFDKMENNLK